MNIRFLIFLIVVVLIVGALVYFELGRDNPWNSDVFFGSYNAVLIDQTRNT